MRYFLQELGLFYDFHKKKIFVILGTIAFIVLTVLFIHYDQPYQEAQEKKLREYMAEIGAVYRIWDVKWGGCEFTYISRNDKAASVAIKDCKCEPKPLESTPEPRPFEPKINFGEKIGRTPPSENAERLPVYLLKHGGKRYIVIGGDPPLPSPWPSDSRFEINCP